MTESALSKHFRYMIAWKNVCVTRPVTIECALHSQNTCPSTEHFFQCGECLKTKPALNRGSSSQPGDQKIKRPEVLQL